VDPDSRPSIETEGEQLISFDLGRYVEALRKYGWALAALLALGITAAVIYTNRQPKVYQAKASVLIEPRTTDWLGKGDDGFVTSGGGGLDYYKQQRQVLASYSLINATVRNYKLYTGLLSDVERDNTKLEDQIELATRRLQQNLSVRYPDQDRIMYVVVNDGDRKFAADISNAHVDTYIAYTKNQLKVGTEDKSGALETEFNKATEMLAKSESALYKFQKDEELLAVSLEDRQSLASANIASFTQKMNEARAQRIEMGSRLDRMRKQVDVDILESPVLNMTDSSASDTLRAQYYTERNRFHEISREFGPKTPEYQKQKAKVDDLHNALKSEQKRMFSSLVERHMAALQTEQALGAEVERFKKQALDLIPKIGRYLELQRQKKSDEDNYNILRNRLSTSQMTGRMNTKSDTSYAKILDRALVPEDPVSPSLRVNIMVAGGISLLLGIGLLVLVVFLDRSIKSTADAQQAAGVPVLGVIPLLSAGELPRDDDRARDMYVHEHPTSRTAECCRSLRTNILFSGADRKLKTLAVSSASPREGKTTSVIYLGTTMAQSGQRVLLIDTDMRRPRLHASTGVPRGHGLSNLILGDQTYEDVIKTTQVPNLFVLPCGPLPPNPAELLMTKRFEVVLEELANRFDRVILDSPPLQAVTDAVVLSKLVDGTILVVRSGKTLRDEIRRSARLIRDVNGSIFGVIVNEFDASDRNGYHYSYYGYGEDERAEPAA